MQSMQKGHVSQAGYCDINVLLSFCSVQQNVGKNLHDFAQKWLLKKLNLWNY